MSTSFANRNAAAAAALVDELVRAGVRDVCVSPGSRSTPLALAAANAAKLRLFVHLDERAAGFFALGLAKASRKPVALICTSGTAAANYLPAIVEASLARVPLVVLTADRPPELRDCGAPQTIDQLRLYGSFARLFIELPLPEPTAGSLRQIRATAARAVAASTASPPGPVQLNVPFREPLEPVCVESDIAALREIAGDIALVGREDAPWLDVVHATPSAPDARLVDALADVIAATPDGVIHCGPQEHDPALSGALARLADAAGWAFLADAASQARSGTRPGRATPITTHDAWLRDPVVASALRPELVLAFGGSPISRATQEWLARHAERLWRVDPDGRRDDPSHLAERLVHADPTALADALAFAVAERRGIGNAHARGNKDASGALATRFREIDRRARIAIDEAIAAESELFGPRVLQELAAALPDGAALFLSNSMSIREADGFLAASPSALRILCNRGANGIDGITSSAFGAAAALDAPLALLTGDLAFLHDVGGLLAASRHSLRATIVVLNDDGGGIFSYLPIARVADPDDFRTLFSTPHGRDLSHATALAGGRHRRVSSAVELTLALKEAIPADGLDVIEVPICGTESVAHHRALWDVAARVARETLS